MGYLLASGVWAAQVLGFLLYFGKLGQREGMRLFARALGLPLLLAATYQQLFRPRLDSGELPVVVGSLFLLLNVLVVGLGQRTELQGKSSVHRPRGVKKEGEGDI